MKKKRKIIVIIMVLLLFALSMGVLFVQYLLPNVGDAPNLHVSQSANVVARGKYLADYVAGCKDCHSQKNAQEFSMPVIPGTEYGGGQVFDEKQGFPGKIVVPNITPSALNSWTDGEIYRAITQGVTKNGKALFPFMPYHNYGQLDQKDIFAIIAYLRGLPAIKSDWDKTSLNFPMRLIVNTIPKKSMPNPMPDTSNRIAYGQYLVTAAGCMGCHSPKTDKGKIISGKEFSGGFAFMLKSGVIRSSNLTADKETGIGNWPEEMFVQKFSQYDSSFTPYTIPNGINTVMPWSLFGKMKPSDIKAIYAYLRTIAPIKNQVIRFTAHPK